MVGPRLPRESPAFSGPGCVMSDGNRAGGLVGWERVLMLRSAKTEGVGLGGDGEANVAVKSRTPRCDVEMLFCLTRL